LYSFGTIASVILFQMFPVFFQVLVVCIFLFVRYDWYFGVVTFATIFFYFVFTLTTTEVRG